MASSHITLTHLGFATADGRTLFSGLDLAFGPTRTGLVGRNGVGKSTLLKLISGELVPRTGSVSISGTLAMLRQSLAPGDGETVAGLFGVADAMATLALAMKGDATAEELADIDWTLEARLEAALARFGLAAGPETALDHLSGGQRTRAMLAALVFAEPDFILLDEPTNNLDRDGRDAVLTLLAQWQGGAIVVSHDRELLEAMDAIVELMSLGAKTYGGGWSFFAERKAIEMAAAEHRLDAAEQRLAEVERKAQATRERKARKDGAGRKSKAAGGAPKILLNARQGKAENSSGTLERVHARQQADALAETEAARVDLATQAPTVKMDLPSTGLAAGRSVLTAREAKVGREGRSLQGDGLSFAITGPERVALVGPNGVGKSTLLATIAGALPLVSGTLEVHVKAVLLDQQVGLLAPERSIRDNFLSLNPKASENQCRAALARFAFRADAGLRTVGTLSGGETLRAGLACVLGGETPLLMLDEPTNHLDLDSIAAVEAGLAGHDGALIVASHDRAFLEAIGITREIALRPG
ncbi:ABC-F family ATP-binding cassette domain-containing protein [Pelagibacterium montanilacus]|uniref:ABC-F family ATP-binding cassette domain-containing protein n=1 Tax=Pelagibacterium montanilacus TaxID=2185280 RepID=UPI000F8F3AC2|nr:ABC-F family ATP-binding cassette domain-containing protein [Pelagibacterium montanilacus]